MARSDGRKPKKGEKKKPGLPRREWSRSPAQKPHSTPKGKKGYRRDEDRKLERDASDEAP